MEAKQNAAKQAEATALQERIALQKAHAAELAERLEAINEISRQRTELQVWHNSVDHSHDTLHASTVHLRPSMPHVLKNTPGKIASFLKNAAEQQGVLCM